MTSPAAPEGVRLPPSVINDGDAYVRSHDIYLAFAVNESRGTARGARWLARDAYQAGYLAALKAQKEGTR